MAKKRSHEYVDYVLSAFHPDPIYSVSEWADEHRYLSNKASAEPGKWKTSRTPYLKEIMDSLSVTDPAKIVVFMKGSQIGGSEVGNNFIAYIIDHAPGPAMVIMPSLDLAKRNSRQRIQPLIEESPRLIEKVAEAKSKDSSNTILMKDFQGGVLICAGANSAAGLKSTPCRYIFGDEIDEYPKNLEDQGSPINLALVRSRTFSRRKAYLVSSPTIDGYSEIQDYYEASDKRKYLVPCPFCDRMQELTFNQLKWPKDEPDKAEYECVNCNKLIPEWRKTKMLSSGKWVAFAKSDVKGYHLNSLYSPLGWLSWGDIATEFTKAKKEPERLKVFVNTILGECWKDKGEAPDHHRLYERREHYDRNTVHPSVAFITIGCDVQKDRIEAEVVGWCKNKVSYSIDYRVMRGDTSTEHPWNELKKLINETWDTDKGPMPAKLVGIDSGFNTQTVYNVVRQFSPTRVVATKGVDHLNTIVGTPRAADVTIKGKTIKRGLKVWPLGVSIMKGELYGWLRQNKAKDDEEDPVGYCHFPEYDENYFKGLTAEQLQAKAVKGFKKLFWVKTFEQNEPLDCRIIARACAAICGLDRMTDKDFQNITVASKISAGQTAVTVSSPRPKKKRIREDWF